MGQPVAVVEKPASRRGVVRFELNRTLTGMGHERFVSEAAATGSRPSAVLARRLFETGAVDSVHVYANVVTVELKRGYTAEGLREIVEDLYVYYREGFVPPPLEMPQEEAPAAAAAPSAGGGEPSPALSEAAKRVPAHLLERSRLARERAKAKAAAQD